MAPAAKNNTPGRRKRTDNQYFEPGKRGRKTGIELKDLGDRDEHGLEPIDGIFSSPYENGKKTLTSEEMDLQNSTYMEWLCEVGIGTLILCDCRFCARCTTYSLAEEDTTVPAAATIHAETHKYWIAEAHVFCKAFAEEAAGG